MTIKRVFERLSDLIPDLEMRPGKTVQAYDLIQQWLKDGLDAELDILPAINAAFAKMIGRPTSAAYFDKPVRLAHAARVKSAAHLAKQDEQRERAILFNKKLGIYVPTYDEEWLEKRQQQEKKP